MKVKFSGADDDYLNTATIEIDATQMSNNNIKTLENVLAYIYKTEQRSHKSFFRADGSLVNGTICLIDEEDAELREPEEQVVDENSVVVFISTLHGG